MNKPYNKCGCVAIVGRANVGKSTLLNYLLSFKLSITSKKVQTTRHQIKGVQTKDNYQIVYIDTPGFNFDQTSGLNKHINKCAQSVIDEVDVFVFVVEALIWNKVEQWIFDKLVQQQKPVILVVNKIDKIHPKTKLLSYLEQFNEMSSINEIIPISALKEKGALKKLEDNITHYLPKGPFLFEKDELTDCPEKFLVSEIIREKLIRHLGEELPHELTVEVIWFKLSEDHSLVNIAANIWVAKKGQKNIVIGKQGQLLKQIGIMARKEIEDLLNAKAYLNLWVKIKEGWHNNEQLLNQLGYNHN